MVFAVAGGGQLDTGYTIDNSLRFNDGDSPTLSRTPASTGNRKTWTFSYWIKRSTLSTVQQTFAVGTNAATPWFLNYINSDDTLHVWFHNGTNSYFSYGLNKLRDVSAWYHIIYAVDTTQATASNRLKVYINGSEMTWNTYAPPAQNFDTQVNTTSTHYIGRSGNGQYFDGYTSEVHFIDGQALSPTDFGEFDEDSGIWKPIRYSGSYGTNGFYLDFENSGSLGADQSGNGNNFTPTNLASTDQTTDTPTNNFATMNPLAVTSAGTATFSEGNCQVATVVSGSMGGYSTLEIPSSGVWYCEAKITTSGVTNAYIGLVPYASNDSNSFVNSNSVFYYGDGTKYVNGSNSAYGTGWSQNNIIGIKVDADSSTVQFYLNGSSQGSISHSVANMSFNCGDTNPSVSHTFQWNFGNPVYSVSSGNSDANGYGNFEYSPSGGLALCTQNLATELSPTIDDGSQYFNTVLWTGNNSNPRTITGVGFQSDFAWTKCRTNASHHKLYDSNRGLNIANTLNSSGNDAEYSSTNGGVSGSDSDGFIVNAGSSNDNAVNDSAFTYVAWNWKANAGSTSSNTNGSITSTVQANPTAGFSIVTYTGTGSNATIGHGLGVAPKMIICKQRNNTLAHDWMVYHEGIGNTKYLNLNQTNASGTASTVWQNTTPTSSVFSVGTSGSVNQSGKNQLAYCFAEIEGYSKFGKYTGNGSTNGTFVFTSFRPHWIMIKKTNNSSQWVIHDTTRQEYNMNTKILQANNTSVESTTSNADLDILSNGFKLRSSDDAQNGSGDTYIYMCFAENPFVSSGAVPVTAR